MAAEALRIKNIDCWKVGEQIAAIKAHKDIL